MFLITMVDRTTEPRDDLAYFELRILFLAGILLVVMNRSSLYEIVELIFYYFALLTMMGIAAHLLLMGILALSKKK